MLNQQIAAATAPASGAGGMQQIGMFIFMIAIFYFVLIRPQRRREKERKEMISAVKKGERVVLTSGIIGEVSTVKDKTLLVRIAENTNVEVVKSAVSQIIAKGETPEEIQG